jgi:hypothetical protein
MLEAIVLAVVGVPIIVAGMLIWSCCIVVVIDAVCVYCGGRRAEKVIRGSK